MTLPNDTTTQPPPPPPSPDQPVPAEYDLICENCGYSLVGLIGSNRCPECGEAFDPNQLPLARVPWLFRSRVGMFKAFIQTIGAIMLRPDAFVAEMCRPVRICPQDAAAFRKFNAWVTAGFCWLASLLIGIGPIPASPRTAAQYIGGSLGFLLGVRVLIGFISDMPTFIWPGVDGRDQKELSPLQNYAAAPAAFLPVAAAGLLMANFFGNVAAAQPLALVFGLLTLVSTVVIFACLWLIPIRFMVIATGCSLTRAVLLGVYLPLHFAFGTLAGLVVGSLVGTAMAAAADELFRLVRDW